MIGHLIGAYAAGRAAARERRDPWPRLPYAQRVIYRLGWREYAGPVQCEQLKLELVESNGTAGILPRAGEVGGSNA